MVRRTGPSSSMQAGNDVRGCRVGLEARVSHWLFGHPAQSWGRGAGPFPDLSGLQFGQAGARGAGPALGERGPWHDPVRLSGKFCDWPSSQQWAKDVAPGPRWWV